MTPADATKVALPISKWMGAVIAAFVFIGIGVAMSDDSQTVAAVTSPATPRGGGSSPS